MSSFWWIPLLRNIKSHPSASARVLVLPKPECWRQSWRISLPPGEIWWNGSSNWSVREEGVEFQELCAALSMKRNMEGGPVWVNSSRELKPRTASILSSLGGRAPEALRNGPHFSPEWNNFPKFTAANITTAAGHTASLWYIYWFTCYKAKSWKREAGICLLTMQAI